MLLLAAGHHKAAVSSMSGRDFQQGIWQLSCIWQPAYNISSLHQQANGADSVAHVAVVGMQKEASEVFFSVTKLFQNKDANLRRMVYLVIKDVCPSADEVIVITSSLMKDMNSKTDLYRSNAIRVLCSITDTQLLAQIERSALQFP